MTNKLYKIAYTIPHLEINVPSWTNSTDWQYIQGTISSAPTELPVSKLICQLISTIRAYSDLAPPCRLPPVVYWLIDCWSDTGDPWGS